MALQPLQSDVTQQPTEGDAAADRPASFRERKMAQLHDEPQPEAGRRETPAESDDDPEHDYEDSQLEYDRDHTGDVEDDSPGALTESPSDDDNDTASHDSEDDELTYEQLSDKYRSLQQEHSRVTAHRKQIEQDFSDGIAENITFRHQLEDLNTQANKRAEFFLGLANQQVQQLENMDWSQVPPDKMAAVKQRYQKAVTDRDQLVQVLQATQTESQNALEQVKKREAEIARNQLARRIPEWSNDHYMKLRDHANALGYTADEFNDITDWRIIDLIHKDYSSQQAVKSVQQVKRKRKARVPRNRNARPQPRSADGRYRKSRDEAFDNPGDKGSFREMKMRQMERERREGR